MVPPSFRIGVDIGGTFTDIVLITQCGSVRVAKIVSTTDAYERGILEALDVLLENHDLISGNCREIVHGTTVATNAILEGKGALTCLITTKGFRDILELRRIRFPKQYDISWEKPRPLVERDLRLEVTERINFKGEVVTALDERDVQEVIGKIKSEKVDSVAISFLHSYANPSHERKVKEIIRSELSSVHLSLSSDVLPEMREYERTSTTVINSYVMPIVCKYIESLREGLQEKGYSAPLLVMQSTGGIMTADIACERPVHIIESGPAAGVMASSHLANRIGAKNVITMDIGGTTAKASLIENGGSFYSREYEVGEELSQVSRLSRGGGYVLRSPTLDISEIGAGGGSIVWIDSGGALRVGPKSAGANPGPACYGLGGTEPTLTDACLLLGYIEPKGIAGGSVPLNSQLSKKALKEKIATPLATDLIKLAYGVVRIAVANMTRAIRSVSTERGKDPRDFQLFSFGGNGGIFGSAVARELEIKKVLIPPSSGIFSAFGLLYSDIEHHFTQTFIGQTDELDPQEVEEMWKKMEEEARTTLSREGYSDSRCKLARKGELRYLGQTYELPVLWPEGSVNRKSLSLLTEAFECEHERTYGYRGQDSLVELVNLHLIATGLPDVPRFPKKLHFHNQDTSKEGVRNAYFGPNFGWMKARLLNRQSIGKTPNTGPIIIQENDATLVVPPDYEATRDSWNNIIIAVNSKDNA